ncbi:hypothetical protein Pelo_16913 [Pelomyxa schiedti]|nr:hypothetical protein Pelo_16913 [Pelomyxa schiedti]
MKGDRFHGEGVRLWSNGDRYQGSWDDGKEHGKGTKRWAGDGSSFTGVWERGVPVKGTMEWPNGDKFTGTFTEVTGAAQGETKRYRGEGVMSLSPLSSQDGDRQPDPADSQFKGILQGNTFHGSTDGALHMMGSFSHRRLMQELTQEKFQLQEQLFAEFQRTKEEEVLVVGNTANPASQIQSEALSEVTTAFKVATQFRSQVKKAAPLLVSLEESVTQLKLFLQDATTTNQTLGVHFRDLSALKETLENVVNESDKRCKQVLGQTLTVESSESEIQQCSRNISLLTKKLLGIKPSANEVESQSVPCQDINKLMTLKPWSLVKLPDPPDTPSSSVPFTLLRELSDLAPQIPGVCKFEVCIEFLEQHTRLHKECNAQVTLSQNLHSEIETLLGVCQKLQGEFQSKYTLMRGLEGDEQFMAHPDVWSQLSELLPHAQQAVMEVTLAKCIPQQPPVVGAASTDQTTKIQPQGGESSGINNNGTDCIVCDERPRSIRFHPCGHGVCCSECASNVRKCPLCRAQIQQRQKLFL